MAKSTAEMKASMIAGLADNTGKPLEAWLKLLQAAKLTRHKEMVTLLKATHGLTHGYANMIALQALGSDSHTQTDTQRLIEAQYAESKAGLRPIYDAVIKAISKFGNDVEISPKKGYVSLRRSKQFAIIQPSTASRVDIGLVMKSPETHPRLEKAGSFNAMMTHRVRLSNVADVDEQLCGWLKLAYEGAAAKG